MPGEGQTADTSNREQLQLFREIVSEVVASLRSQEVSKSYVALSIEELVDRRIATLTASEDPMRRSRREQVEKIYNDFMSQIEAMKATDPVQFRRASANDTANTAEES